MLALSFLTLRYFAEYYADTIAFQFSLLSDIAID
jgi:hypothetical protein